MPACERVENGKEEAIGWETNVFSLHLPPSLSWSPSSSSLMSFLHPFLPYFLPSPLSFSFCFLSQSLPFKRLDERLSTLMMCAVHVESIKSVCWVWLNVPSPWVVIQRPAAQKNTHFGIQPCGKSNNIHAVCFSPPLSLSEACYYSFFFFHCSFPVNILLISSVHTHRPSVRTPFHPPRPVSEDCPSVCEDRSCAQTLKNGLFWEEWVHVCLDEVLVSACWFNSNNSQI